MKRILTACALLATTAYADANIDLPRQPANPVMIVGTYDISTNPASILQDATISKNNPNHRMCWRAENITPNAEHVAIEHILSPDAATFIDKDAQNGRSPSGRYHRITRSLTADASGAFQKCWQFGSQDPNGEYQIQVVVDELQFPVRIFFVGE